MSESRDDICVYCALVALSGAEDPEHPLPLALGSSLTVDTSCDECNRWASKHVDKPFLREPLVLMLRSQHGVRDPRRPGPLHHPMAEGFTDEGVRIVADEVWQPRIAEGRIVPDVDDPQQFHIVAGSEEEAERLLERLERRAAEAGQSVQFDGIWNWEKVHPRVTGHVRIDAGPWLRMAAKLGLALGSKVFPPEWRLGPDARALRDYMRDPASTSREARPVGVRLADEQARQELLRTLVSPPKHAAWFVRGLDGTTELRVVVFGHSVLAARVDSEGRSVPEHAWLIDPIPPRSVVDTTYRDLVRQAGLRHVAHVMAAEGEPSPPR